MAYPVKVSRASCQFENVCRGLDQRSANKRETESFVSRLTWHTGHFFLSLYFASTTRTIQHLKVPQRPKRHRTVHGTIQFWMNLKIDARHYVDTRIRSYALGRGQSGEFHAAMTLFSHSSARCTHNVCNIITLLWSRTSDLKCPLQIQLCKARYRELTGLLYGFISIAAH